jgi:hypothetical protein
MKASCLQRLGDATASLSIFTKSLNSLAHSQRDVLVMVANQQDDKTAESTTTFEADPDHAAAVNQAIQAIRELVQANPEFGDQLRLAASTDDVRKLLQAKGIDITDEALWRHRGALLGDGTLTWRG